MSTKTSYETVPSGLELYFFEYPDGWRELPENVECLDGKCDPSPAQCFLENDAEAKSFAELYGAIRATHGVSGRVVYSDLT